MTTVTRTFWDLLAILMGHLKRDETTGHLLHGDGTDKHLVSDCCPFPETLTYREIGCSPSGWDEVDCEQCQSDFGCESMDCSGDGTDDVGTGRRANWTHQQSIPAQEITLTHCGDDKCGFYTPDQCPTGPNVDTDYTCEVLEPNCLGTCPDNDPPYGSSCGERMGYHDLAFSISCGANDGEYNVTADSRGSIDPDTDCGGKFEGCTTAEVCADVNCRCTCETQPCVTTPPEGDPCSSELTRCGPDKLGGASTTDPCDAKAKDIGIGSAAGPENNATLTATNNRWTVRSCDDVDPAWLPCPCDAEIDLPSPGPCDEAP